VIAIEERTKEVVRAPKERARWAYPVGLFFVTLLFFATTLIHNALPASLDILAIRYPWNQLSPAFAQKVQRDGVQNLLLSDQTEVFIPGFRYAREQMRRGSIPLWTPTEAGGAPFLANDQSAVLYPVNFLAYLLPLTVALQLLYMIRPFGAGLGMYFFLCSIGVRRSAAFFGAISFMFSNYFIVWLGWPLPSVATWLPWMLLAIERLLQGDRARSRWVALLAFATGSHLLAGHIETSIHVFLAFGMYALCRLGWVMSAQRRNARTVALRSALVGGGVALGIALAAAQLLPTAWYLFRASYTYGARQHSPPFPPLPLSDLIFWVVPNFNGSPSFATLGNDFATGFTNYNERVGYCGVVTLVLAVLAFAHPIASRRPYRWTFVILLIISGGIAYGFGPIWDVAIHLPLLNLADNYRLTFVMAFAIAALAAIGFDGIIERLGPLRSSWWRGLTIVDTLCIVGGSVFAVGAAFISKKQIVSLMSHFTRNHLVLSAPTWASLWTLLALTLVAVSIVLIRLIAISAIEPSIGMATLTLLLIGDVFTFGATYNPQMGSQYLYPPTSLSEEIRSLGPDVRYSSPLNLFPMNFGQWYDFRTLDAYEGIVLDRAHNFLSAINRNGPSIGDWTHVGANESPDYRLLAIGDVTHVLLLTSEAEPSGLGGHLVLQHEDPSDVPLPPLSSHEEEAQDFVAPVDNIDGIAFTISMGKQPSNATLTFQLIDVATGGVLVTHDVSTTGLSEGSPLPISFPSVEHSRGRKYRVSITARGENTAGSTSALYGNPSESLPGGQRYRNGFPVPGSLRIRLYESIEKDGLTPVWQGGSGTLYAIDDARPRAYIANGVVTAPDGNAALAALDQLHVPGSDAVIEARQPMTSAGGTVTFLHDEPGDIAVRAEADSSGVLVLNEGYGDGGWQVDIDGKPATDLHANYLYQGVTVPAGEHTVHFRYRPRSFIIGASISAVAGIGILGLLVVPIFACSMKRLYSRLRNGLFARLGDARPRAPM
jgi:hypothetical protein